MSVSNLSSSSVLQVQQQQHRRPPGGGKEVREGIDQLKTALQSGDLEATQKAYDSLSELQSKRQGSGTSTTGTSTGKDDPLSKMLSQVGEALKTGDVTKVQEAFAQSGPPQGGGRGGPGGPPPGGPPPGGQGPSDDVKQALGQLGQSLGSGDLSGAQTAYQSLSEMLGGEDDSTTSSSSTSSTSKSTTSAADRFKELMGDLGSALQTGHLATAQSLFSSMVPRGSQGVDVMA